MINPLAFFNPGRWMLYLLLAAAVVFWIKVEYSRVDQRGYDRAAGVFQKAIDRQKGEAATLLAVETAKTEMLQGRLNAAHAALESNDAQNAKTINVLAADLRAATRAGGGPGLRDPNAARCWPRSDSPESPASAGAASGPGDGTAAGGLVSPELERLLQDHTDKADKINRAYIICRADAINNRSQQ